jgi:hypothetical protein
MDAGLCSFRQMAEPKAKTKIGTTAAMTGGMPSESAKACPPKALKANKPAVQISTASITHVQKIAKDTFKNPHAL